MQDESYANNPVWADVQPIPQDDGANPLVPIAYSREYSEAMDYFRAVSRANEKSQRVLELTAHIIDMNPAHYTICRRQYRQSLLDALKVDLEEELNFIDELAEDKSKNYQIWHHRQVVVEKLGDGSREIPFINQIIEEGSKNYHAWSYRQWVIQKFDLWQDELAYVEDALRIDVRNNSAWNHRYFVVFSHPGQEVDQATIDREIDVIRTTGHPVETLTPFLEDLNNGNTQSPYLLSTEIQVYESVAKKEKRSVDKKALELCDMLATKYDPVRHKYWQFKKTQLQAIAA
ncbi:hypothetical protein NQZ79_g53 [Umbelopsis isabellina]|nr:hypothetical protein NQZ79_g53 [Umbelopsis isabellina]